MEVNFCMNTLPKRSQSSIFFIAPPLMIRIFSRLLFCLLVITCVASAQNRGGLKGFVSDSSNGERLSLVNLLVIGKSIGAASDANGFYFIGNVPAGRVKVRATIIGYHPMEKEVDIKSGQIVSLNFMMSPTTLQMRGVERTAERRTRYDTEVSTLPISTSEIEIVPAVVEADLFRTISVLPGVVATSDVSSQFYVRGGGGDQNLIVLDGMTIYNPFHALGIFSIFDADAIKEAEVLKGGFPAQWGNRLSSIINIRTREGNKNRLSGKVNVSQVSGKVELEGPTPWDGSWMIAGRKSFMDDVLQNFVAQDTPFDFYDLIARINHATTDNGRISLHMLLTQDKIQPTKSTEPEYQWSNKAGSLSWFQLLENRYLLETSFSYSTFKGELKPRENRDIPPRLSEINDTYFNGNVTYFQENGDLFGAGFMFRLPQFHYSFVNSSSVARDITTRMSETGIWVRYKYKQLEPFAFEAGLRSDLFAVLSTHSSDVFEPRLAASWDITPLLNLKLSYSRVHQRMLTITNEDDIVSLFETWIPLSDNMQSQQADHYIIGIDGSIDGLPGFSFNIQGWYKDFSHLLDYNRDKVDASDPDFTDAKGRSYGVEVFIERKDPFLSGWVSYTYGYTERTIGSFTYNPRYDRRHNLNMIASLRPFDGWEFSIRWEYGSGLPFTQITGSYDRIGFGGLFNGSGYSGESGSPYTILGSKNSGRLPAYHRLDISLSKSFQFGFTKLTIEGSVLNAYNHKNMFYFNRTTGERINMLPILPTLTLKAEF
jgi:hypothetical protein